MSNSTANVYQNIVDYCTLRDINFTTFEQLCKLSNGTVKSWTGEKAVTPSLRLLDRIQDATGITVGHWIKKGGVRCAVMKSREALGLR